jgi:hypothetical protein
MPCHVERSETSLIYFRGRSIQNSSEILRSAQNDIVCGEGAHFGFWISNFRLNRDLNWR